MSKNKMGKVEQLIVKRVDELHTLILEAEKSVIQSIGKSNYLRYGAVAQRRMLKSLLKINNDILRYSFGYNIPNEES